MTTNPVRVLVRDFAAVNFDAICRAAIEMAHVLKWPLEDIVVVRDGDGDYDIDIEGHEVYRKYWELGGRSMTELYAIKVGLGNADASGVVCVDSDIPGLVSLCRSLAENHGRIDGVRGGALNKPRTIYGLAKGLSLLPNRASEIVDLLVKSVIRALEDRHPIVAMSAAAGHEFKELDKELANAERKLAAKAKSLVGEAMMNNAFFPLDGVPHTHGMLVVTDQPDLPKHIWAALRVLPDMHVAAMVVQNASTGRLAILTSNRYPVDVEPVAEELQRLFHGANFSVDEKRGMVVWDSKDQQRGAPVLTAQDLQTAVAEHLGLYKEEPPPAPTPAPKIGATLGDSVRAKQAKKGQSARQ